MSLSVCKASSLEISNDDVNEIYVFIVVVFGVFMSLIIAQIMNVRTIQKTTYKNDFD
jgi:hypothetical protein